MTATRVEKDPLGPLDVPGDALYGVQTVRARQNPRVDFDAVLEQNVGRILAEIDRLDEIARAFSRYGTAPAERPPPNLLITERFERPVRLIV